MIPWTLDPVMTPVTALPHTAQKKNIKSSPLAPQRTSVVLNLKDL